MIIRTAVTARKWIFAILVKDSFVLRAQDGSNVVTVRHTAVLPAWQLRAKLARSMSAPLVTGTTRLALERRVTFVRKIAAESALPSVR